MMPSESRLEVNGRDAAWASVIGAVEEGGSVGLLGQRRQLVAEEGVARTGGVEQCR